MLLRTVAQGTSAACKFIWVWALRADNHLQPALRRTTCIAKSFACITPNLPHLDNRVKDFANFSYSGTPTPTIGGVAGI